MGCPRKFWGNIGLSTLQATKMPKSHKSIPALDFCAFFVAIFLCCLNGRIIWSTLLVGLRPFLRYLGFRCRRIRKWRLPHFGKAPRLTPCRFGVRSGTLSYKSIAASFSTSSPSLLFLPFRPSRPLPSRPWLTSATASLSCRLPQNPPPIATILLPHQPFPSQFALRFAHF